jgi:hypothetical protein
VLDAKLRFDYFHRGADVKSSFCFLQPSKGYLVELCPKPEKKMSTGSLSYSWVLASLARCYCDIEVKS